MIVERSLGGAETRLAATLSPSVAEDFALFFARCPARDERCDPARAALLAGIANLPSVRTTTSLVHPRSIIASDSAHIRGQIRKPLILYLPAVTVRALETDDPHSSRKPSSSGNSSIIPVQSRMRRALTTVVAS